MTARVPTLMLGCAFCAALSIEACGGATGDPLGRGKHDGSGGADAGGSGGGAQGGDDGSGGAETGAAPGAGGKSAPGRGGSPGSGGRIGAGGSIGTGGRVAAGGGAGAGGGMGAGGRIAAGGSVGTGGVPSWSCRTPYKPPIVGPRNDGPLNPGTSCENLSDTVVLGRYADDSAKVPIGFFYEEPGEIVNWDLSSGCSSSLGETVAAARTEVGGNPDGSATTPYFYEAAVCNGEARTRYRRIRCDYYDGMHLKRGPTGGVDDLLFWAGLMWFAPNQNLGGANLISGNMAIGNATDVAEICTTKTTYGDFGLCDSITLTSTNVRGSVDGTVEVVTIIDERTIKGKCR